MSESFRLVAVENVAGSAPWCKPNLPTAPKTTGPGFLFSGSTELIFNGDGSRLLHVPTESVVDPATGRVVGTFGPGEAERQAGWRFVELTPDRRFAFWQKGATGEWQRRQTETGEAAGLIVKQQETPEPALFSRIPPSARRRLVSNSDGSKFILYGSVVHVLDTVTGKQLPGISTPSEIVLISFSPDGNLFLTAEVNGTVRVWDASTGELASPPLTHVGALAMARFSRDGKRVLTASGRSRGSGNSSSGSRSDSECNLCVWDVASGQPLTPPLPSVLPSSTTYTPNAPPVDTVSSVFDPDGTAALRQHSDGVLELTDLATEERPLEELRGEAELLSGRRLNAAGWPLPLDGERFRDDWSRWEARAWPVEARELLDPVWWHHRQFAVCIEGQGQFLPRVRQQTSGTRLGQVLPKGPERRPGQGRPDGGARVNAGPTSELIENAERWHLDRLVELKPQDAGFQLIRARFLNSIGNPAGAEAALHEVIRLDGKNVEAHGSLARALLKKGDPDGAVEHYGKVIQFDPNNVPARLNLGWILLLKGDLPGAEKQFRTSIGLDEKNAVAHNYLGLVLQQKGELKEAIAEHKAALRIAPSNPDAAKSLARAERMLALLPHLPDVIAGKVAPDSPADACEYAVLCAWSPQKRHVAAVRLFSAAFAAEPKLADDLYTDRRYNAACSATRAASGDGIDAPADPEKQADLRRKALAWLRADLALHKRQAASTSATERNFAADRLTLWLADGDLASVRPGKLRIETPADERAEWDALWTDVRTTISVARNPPAPKPSLPPLPPSKSQKPPTGGEIAPPPRGVKR